MIAWGNVSIASPHASAPPWASRTCQRKPVSIALSLCRKLPSALATSAVRGRSVNCRKKSKLLWLPLCFS